MIDSFIFSQDWFFKKILKIEPFSFSLATLYLYVFVLLNYLCVIFRACQIDRWIVKGKKNLKQERVRNIGKFITCMPKDESRRQMIYNPFYNFKRW